MFAIQTPFKVVRVIFQVISVVLSVEGELKFKAKAIALLN